MAIVASASAISIFTASSFAEIRDTSAGQNTFVPRVRKARPQDAAERPVGYDVTHGFEALFPRIDAREAEPALVRHVNLGDGRRQGAERRPHPHGLEDSAAAVRECRGALVETRLCRRIMWNGFDEGDAQIQRRERDAPRWRPPCRRRRWRRRSSPQRLDCVGSFLKSPGQHLRRAVRSPTPHPRCEFRCSKTPSESSARAECRSPVRR